MRLSIVWTCFAILLFLPAAVLGQESLFATRPGRPDSPLLLSTDSISLAPTSDRARIGVSIQEQTPSRSRLIWIGAGVGAGISTLGWLGFVCAIYCSGESDGYGIEIFATPIVTVLGAGIGAAVGALWPRDSAGRSAAVDRAVE